MVLISFREWLHSYLAEIFAPRVVDVTTEFSSLSESGFIPTRCKILTTSGRMDVFSSLSESGFIPTKEAGLEVYQRRFLGSHLFQRVASFLPGVIPVSKKNITASSHLFQRVASFLQ